MKKIIPKTIMLLDSGLHTPVLGDLGLDVDEKVPWRNVNNLAIWQGKRIKFDNAFNTLKDWIKEYNLRIGIIACNQDHNSQGFHDYLVKIFGRNNATDLHNRVYGQWKFLGKLH